MEGLKITRRGWVVIVLMVITLAVLVNVFMSGKNVSCDLRAVQNGCSVQEMPTERAAR
jgi:hypothetical protein